MVESVPRSNCALGKLGACLQSDRAHGDSPSDHVGPIFLFSFTEMGGGATGLGRLANGLYDLFVVHFPAVDDGPVGILGLADRTRDVALHFSRPICKIRGVCLRGDCDGFSCKESSV
jgi:hypothetical protein